MADGGFGWSEGIAALSLGVSGIALLWAKTSADAAKQANRLQLHNNQRQLLVAFDAIHSRVFILQEGFEAKELIGFEEHAITCYLYVSKDLAERIVDYYKRCFQIELDEYSVTLLARRIQRFSERDQKEGERLARELNDKSKSAETFIKKLIEDGKRINEDLRNEIRIDPPKPNLWETLLYEYNKPFDWGDEKEPE